jgi:hypothetical protein
MNKQKTEKREKEEKEEKEEKKGTYSTGDLRPKFQGVLDAINKIEEAKKVFRTLIAAGCDRTDLLAALYWYCGNSPVNTAAPMTNVQRERVKRRIEELRIDEQKFARRLEDGSKKLKEVADQVDGLLSEFPERTGMTHHGETLPSEMRDFAEYLNCLHRASKKILRDLKRDQDGTIMAGRKQYLFYLACLVREVTEEPNPMIARLVAAVRGEKEPNYPKLANTLGRAVDRYKEKHLLWCLVIADQVHSKFVDALEATRSPATQSS